MTTPNSSFSTTTKDQNHLHHPHHQRSNSYALGTTITNGTSSGQSQDRLNRWNRAIPEAGYVTLGTLRYGVRLSNPSILHSNGSTLNDNSSIKSLATTITSNDSSHAGNGKCSSGNCCCITSNGLVLPWTNNNNSSSNGHNISTINNNGTANTTRTRLPVPSLSKNRTASSLSSTSSSCSASSSSSSAVTPPSTITSSSSSSPSISATSSFNHHHHRSKGPIALISRDSSPPSTTACCYGTSSANTTKRPTLIYTPPPPPPPQPKHIKSKSYNCSSNGNNIDHHQNDDDRENVYRQPCTNENFHLTKKIFSNNNNNVNSSCSSGDNIIHNNSNNNNNNSDNYVSSKVCCSIINKNNNHVKSENGSDISNSDRYDYLKNKCCDQKIATATIDTTITNRLNCFGKSNSGNSNNSDHNNFNQIYVKIPTSSTIEKNQNVMDKRRNTLDRLQRMGFGRKSRGSDKTERLRELTELLRGTRASTPSTSSSVVNSATPVQTTSTEIAPTPPPPPPPPPLPPPPIPPPRRLRNQNSLDKSFSENISSASDSICGSIDEEQEIPHVLSAPVIPPKAPEPPAVVMKKSNSIFDINLAGRTHSLYKSLRPNSSVSNLENLVLAKDNHKNVGQHNRDSSSGDQTPTPKSAHPHPQKSIPFRSASFSQVDYSSGKYIRSALGAIKAAFTRDKEPSVVDSANLTLPRNKSGSRTSLRTLDDDFSEAREYSNAVDALAVHVNNLSIIPLETHDENVILEEKPICDNSDVNGKITEIPSENELSAETNMAQTSEITLETLTEEDISVDTPTDDSYLQTATTCLIPVPVYECVTREWNAHPATEWISVKEETPMIEEMGISLDMIQEISECDLTPEPAVDVCRDSQNFKMDDDHEVSITANSLDIPDYITQPSVEFVEVRKRNNNSDGSKDNDNDGSGSPSSNEHNPGVNSHEERKRIDKSRRRKGIYIQWPSVGKNRDDDSDNCTDENLTPEDVKLPQWELEYPPDEKLKLLMHANNKVPIKRDSECSAEPGTPEYEYNQQQMLKYMRRKSLTCQSSDEKDDISLTSSPLVNKATKNLIFLRQDSMSDNENDRTPPRERHSASPAPHGGDDVKRYSKRPLRGPYGQMLEAEMKKAGKVLYDELLEELNRQENSLIPNAGREKCANSSFDDTAASDARKKQSHLPIPCHVRAASTPSQMDSLAKTDPIISHKRYPSSIEPFSQTYDTPEKMKVNEKKLSLDSSCEKLAGSKKSDTPHATSKRSLSTDGKKMPAATKNINTLLATPELLAELLKGSSERMIVEQRQKNLSNVSNSSITSNSSNTSNALPAAVLNCVDTRTHVVVELYNTEKSYVESLQTVIHKYFEPLKAPENAGIVDVQIVDEIFFKVPSILSLHKLFLDELKKRLDSWDSHQKIGDAFVEIFSKASVLETYTSFVNNWNKAKNAIRTTSSTRPQFARFLEAMTREHKRKLSLDNLLIKPVQKFPNYELIFQRLIKHTDIDHPDQKPLQDALKLVHDILIHLNCKEKEALENGQRESFLKELEGVIEGVSDLVTQDRKFILFDLVSMPSAQAPRKERGLFLFNDILVITSIKRRSGTIRTKPNLSCPGSVAQTLDTNKYKFLMKISLDDMEIVKAKDENVRKIIKEIDNLTEDCTKLTQIADLAQSLKYPHQLLEDTIRDLQREVQRQLSDRQSNDPQLCLLELTVNLSSGTQNMSLVFSKPEKRNQWEEQLVDAKQKLQASLERYRIPEFFTSIPIRKTRAGLQFTCAAATLGTQQDVWVCNSDGYVGQVCVMSLEPEPTVTSCNGVCNARIMCIASVPANLEASNPGHGVSISIEDTTRHYSNPCINVVTPSSSSSMPDKIKINHNSNNLINNNNNSNDKDSSDIQLDSDSSSDDSEAELAHNEQQNIDNVIMPSNVTPQHQHQESNPDESDGLQSTMWLGTEDGCIHVYNCTDNIRTKKNKIKIQHVTAVYSILYLENRVFVSLANGDICIYFRDHGGWNTTTPLNISIGTVTSPVTKLLNVQGRLWCAIQGVIKVLNIATLQIENQIQISIDSKPITNMTVSHQFVWISIQNSAIIKCFHSTKYELLFEVNLAPSVNKMLSNCDDIIRQHKAACLRITSLLACKDLIWIGTSAGVLLTISSQNLNQNCSNFSPIVTGIPHGHTGHVRFLTFVENYKLNEKLIKNNSKRYNRSSIHGKQNTKKINSKLLVISGGDGYEDFRSSGTNVMSEIAGREDSTNHLLLWHV